MFEDGEFDGIEFSDYDMMHNAEIELDDIDRDWNSNSCFSVILKILTGQESVTDSRLTGYKMFCLSQFDAFLTFH